MTPQEYNAMCDRMAGDIEQSRPSKADPVLRAKRSAVLHQLQKMGVDTTDFSEVDRFILQDKIAGKLQKVFKELTAQEFQGLILKLEAIASKPAKPRTSRSADKPLPEVPIPAKIPD